MDPDDIQANKLFGIYLNDLGETARARTHIERALALDPEDKNLVKILANIN